jgi:hypothetical protein
MGRSWRACGVARGGVRCSTRTILRALRQSWPTNASPLVVMRWQPCGLGAEAPSTVRGLATHPSRTTTTPHPIRCHAVAGVITTSTHYPRPGCARFHRRRARPGLVVWRRQQDGQRRCRPTREPSHPARGTVAQETSAVSSGKRSASEVTILDVSSGVDVGGMCAVWRRTWASWRAGSVPGEPMLSRERGRGDTAMSRGPVAGARR